MGHWVGERNCRFDLASIETLCCLHTSLDIPPIPPHPNSCTSIYLLFSTFPFCSLGQWLRVPWVTLQSPGKLPGFPCLCCPSSSAQMCSFWNHKCLVLSRDKGATLQKVDRNMTPKWCSVPTVCHHESFCLTEDSLFLWQIAPQSTTSSYLTVHSKDLHGMCSVDQHKEMPKTIPWMEKAWLTWVHSWKQEKVKRVPLSTTVPES